MKNKKGFTMMELLAAIVIVGILSSVGVAGILNLRKNQEIKYNQTQNNVFVETAKTYFADNKQYLPTKPGASEDVYVTLGELIEANYITDEFLDYNGKEYDKNSKVQVLKIDTGVYTYRGSLFRDGTEVATTEKAKVDWNFTYRNKTGNLNKVNNKNYTNSTPTMGIKATSKNDIYLLAYMYTVYRDGVKYETSQMIYLGKKKELTDELVLDLASEKYSGDARYKIKISVYDESGYELTQNGEEIVIDTVAPEAPQLVNLYDNRWINKSYTIKGTAKDSSGILEWQHTYKADATTAINSSDWNKYADSAKSSFTTTSFNDEMDKYVYIRVCDYALNCSSSSRSKIKIDKTAPTCGEPTGGNAAWINASNPTGVRTITTTCSDKKGTTHSGCAKDSISYEYSTDINTTKAGAGGDNKGGVIKDNAGNTTTCKANQTVKIDKTAPTKPTLDNPNNDKWVNKVAFDTAGFSYTIKGTTKEDTSGINYWQYTYKEDATETGSDNAASWVTYADSAKLVFTTTPFTAERNQNVYIRTCDKAGNCSEKSSSRIKIDRTPPTCGSFDGESYGTWARSRTITIGCGDNLSGCTANPYPIKSYNSGTIRTDNLSGTIKDNAGNINTCSKNSVGIYVDNEGPSKPGITLFESTNAASYDMPANYTSGSWTNKNVLTRATSSDSGSGIAYYQYSHDGVNWSNSIASLGWVSAYYDNNTRFEYWISWYGNWNFFVRAVDNLGNPGAKSDMFTLRIDRTAPVITSIYNPTGGGWTNSNFSLTATASENESGIASWYYTYTSGSGYNAYANSAYSAITTTPFSAERNQNVYLVACDKVGNCSAEAATPIRIDKTAPTCTNIAKKNDASGSVYKSGKLTCTDVYTNASCSDSASGCRGSKTITTAGETTDVTNAVRDSWTVKAKGDSWVQWTVYDNAGNSKACSEITIKKGKKSASSKCSCKKTKTCSGTCAGYSSWKISTEDNLRRIPGTSTTCESQGTTTWYTDCDISPTGDGAFNCRCDIYTRYCTKRNKTNCGCEEYESCCHEVD